MMSMHTGICSDEKELKEIREKTKAGGYIGLAQINPIAGDLEYNAKKITDYIKYAGMINLDLVIFPESSLCGNLTEHFICRYPFLSDEIQKWLKGIAAITTKTCAIVPFICSDSTKDNIYKIKNCIAVLRNGNIEKILQEYGVVQINNTNYGITTSKELYDNQVIEKLKQFGADVIVNCSSVISREGKEPIVQNLLSHAAISSELPIIHINQTGYVDNIYFDGASRGINKNGKLFARAKSFEEDFLILNPVKTEGKIAPIPDGSDILPNNSNFSLDYENDMERTYKTIIQAIRDYFNKCKLKRAVLGLSGGLDSSVCAVLLADALGKENIYGILMPSKLTSSESKIDAEMLAKNIGIHYSELSIKPVVDITTNCLNGLFNEIELNWKDRYKNSYTPDNIQARTRAVYLWGISNEFPSCTPIATSDKSEAYMGYATINGDMSGGFAPVADITKTKLFALARWMNKNRKEKDVIPENIINKKPGAELAIDPNTGKTLNAEDALMPYEFLDEAIWRTENKNESYDKLLNTEFLYEKKFGISKEQKREWLDKFYRRMSSALYKWSIMPPSVIAGAHSINKFEYNQPITSGRINYKGNNQVEISKALHDEM